LLWSGASLQVPSSVRQYPLGIFPFWGAVQMRDKPDSLTTVKKAVFSRQHVTARVASVSLHRS
jgi:hypothetical protein